MFESINRQLRGNIMYEIWGCYREQWEHIDESNSSTDAAYLLEEYCMAFGSDWKLEVRENF